MIVCEDVSKFYGEVLGVNRISLSIGRGVTSLVGPNGSGKTTLMNLITGLLQPTRGRISVFGVSPTEPEKLFRRVGYCPLFDSFPKGLTGREFVRLYLGLHGFSRARRRADRTGAGARRHDRGRRAAG
jgi:ABC-2 type transport system ATP-binding protein